ncbi:MAG TPA: hypothetical protein VFR84_02160 [Candidatus Angelobacter sp.]|nr:hypothetical protein [Candidatus Angelobacter sp.]
MTNPVSRVAQVKVGGIGAPGLINGVEVGLDLSPCSAKQRTNQMSLSMLRRNSRQATHSTAAENAHKHGFSLVVSRVRGGDLVSLALLDQLGKPAMAQLASGGFQADFVVA